MGWFVATLHSSYIWENVIFDPWRQEKWGTNGTVLIADFKANPDVDPFFQHISITENLSTWYTWQNNGALSTEKKASLKATTNANMSTNVQFDILGSTFLKIASNCFQSNSHMVEENYGTLVEHNIEGSQRSITDALQRKIMMYDYNILTTLRPS